jgi:hypothetical protein
MSFEAEGASHAKVILLPAVMVVSVDLVSVHRVLAYICVAAEL